MANRFLYFSIYLLVGLILLLSIRGLGGNPSRNDLDTNRWKENGPFELSPERGRFALTFSLVEDRSFHFDLPIARFVVPDLAISRDKYVSLFAPLVSFIVIPGYVMGKLIGASQFGTFAVVALFALINAILIRAIAIRVGANKVASTIASLAFLFGSPAFAYAVNLYQHHFSTFLILLSIYILLRSSGLWSLAVVFFLSALAIPLDYPNLFFMLPIGLFAVGRMVSWTKIKEKLFVKVNIFKALTPLVMIIPILFFLWFNYQSYGNPFQVSGTLKTVKGIGADGKPLSPLQLSKQPGARFDINKFNREKTLTGFFKTRNLLNSFYIHFISPDRGIIYYSPVILFGLIGFILCYIKKVKFTPLLSAIIGANVLLYSMWGDPWGGWAFGSRYLIPSYAILAIFIALALTFFRKNLVFLIAFILVFNYSAAVNTLGAITTSALPPQPEVLELEKISGTVQKYTYERNWDFLLKGNSKSFVYQAFGRYYITSVQYYEVLAGLIIFAGLSLTSLLWFTGREKR